MIKQQKQARGDGMMTLPDACSCCGGEVLALPRLVEIMERFDLDDKGLAYEASVPEALVADMRRGKAVAQGMSYRIMETVRRKLRDEEERRTRMGLDTGKGTRSSYVVGGW